MIGGRSIEDMERMIRERAGRVVRGERRGGFTIVELLVSIALFSTLVTIAAGSYTQALRTQRQAAALLAANSNVSLILEQVAREIRTSFDFCSASLLSGSDPGGTICPPPSELTFHNAGIEDVTYRLTQVVAGGVVADGFIERRQIDTSGVDSGWQRLTADNVVVQNLDFILSVDPLYPPRITISISLSPKEKSVGNPINLQTTVSARLL